MSSHTHMALGLCFGAVGHHCCGAPCCLCLMTILSSCGHSLRAEGVRHFWLVLPHLYDVGQNRTTSRNVFRFFLFPSFFLLLPCVATSPAGHFHYSTLENGRGHRLLLLCYKYSQSGKHIHAVLFFQALGSAPSSPVDFHRMGCLLHNIYI